MSLTLEVYIYFTVGMLLGKLLSIAVRSYLIQENPKYPNLNFFDALKVYLTKYTGPLFISFVVMIICLYLLSNAHSISKLPGSTPEDVKYTRTMRIFFKYIGFIGIGIGTLAQEIGFLVIRKGPYYMKLFDGSKSKE